jgi:hypothetical protein
MSVFKEEEQARRVNKSCRCGFEKMKIILDILVLLHSLRGNKEEEQEQEQEQEQAEEQEQEQGELEEHEQ